MTIVLAWEILETLIFYTFAEIWEPAIVDRTKTRVFGVLSNVLFYPDSNYVVSHFLISLRGITLSTSSHLSPNTPWVQLVLIILEPYPNTTRVYRSISLYELTPGYIL